MAIRHPSAKQVAISFQAPKRLDARALPGPDAPPPDVAPPADPRPAPEAAAIEVVEAVEAPISREQRRSRCKREVRARSVSVKRMTKRELELGRLMYPDQPGRDYERPRTRAECVNGPRPCPFASCTHHLYLDVSERTGAIKLNFPDIEVEDMKDSCALDVADRGGETLERVGAIMNLTRERIRQLEVKALAKLEAVDAMASLRDFADEGPVGKRRLPVLRAVGDEGDGDDEDEGDAPGPEAVADLADEFDTDDGFIGISAGVFRSPPPCRTPGGAVRRTRYEDAKRLAAKLVSFESREFSKMFGRGDSECLTMMVRDGYLERTERGRYVTTEKLDAEAAGVGQ